MKTPLVTLPLVLALAAAGCIAVPEDADGSVEAASIAPEERIEGMTMSETMTDATVDCDSGGLELPPRVCAERVLVAEGRIGLDHLPIELIGSNGEIGIRHLEGEGDAWRFTATIRVSALTEDMARRGLDTAWTWTHERDGGHAIVAGPAPVTSVDSLTAHVQSMQYELELPSWVSIDLSALTDNGAIHAEGFSMESVDVETDNGAIVLGGDARDVRARTDNGEIVAALRPLGGGTFDMTTDNGQVILELPEGRAYGYDLSATTDNGQVIIQLADGELDQTESGATFRTKSFDARSIQTKVTLATDNGQIMVGRM